MNQVLKQTPSLRDRIVEVLREHHEVKHIGALADKLESVIPASSVTVKALEWRTLDNGTAWSKATPVGLLYHATKYGWMHRNGDINPTDGIEKAKTAAQADYEARILSALSAQVQYGAEEDWRVDPSRDERWNAGVDYVMKQLCSFLSVDPNNVSWDAATETLDGDIQAVIGNILRGHFGENWGPQRRNPKSLDQLEIRLKDLITKNPEKARLASSREDLRLWFVSELISEASGRIPLLEIEGLVSRQLAVAKGGDA